MDDNKQHEKFMRIAIGLAEENVLENSGTPFGAVIVKDGKIIAKSANKVASSTDPTAHAEISAIRLAAKKLKNVELKDTIMYTSCEPCPMCLSAIYWAGMDRIYYANSKTDAAAADFDDEFIYDDIAKPMSERKIPSLQLLRNEAQYAFKLWEKSPINRE